MVLPIPSCTPPPPPPCRCGHGHGLRPPRRCGPPQEAARPPLPLPPHGSLLLLFLLSMRLPSPPTTCSSVPPSSASRPLSTSDPATSALGLQTSSTSPWDPASEASLPPCSSPAAPTAARSCLPVRLSSYLSRTVLHSPPTRASPRKKQSAPFLALQGEKV